MTADCKLVKVGHYRLTGLSLGKGNFARVEEAIHTMLNVKVAIKIINTSNIKEDYVFKNLRREATVMAQLTHPNIVYLYETMESGSHYYLVSELASGGDLCTHIKRTGKLEERHAKKFARQLAAALGHMHTKGIVHRDLKMENIMLDGSREYIKIVDFGLSNFWCPEEPLKTHCGSPEYAAPELFVVGKRYGPEVDLWSLGVILFGMVTGRLPFISPMDPELSGQEKRNGLLVQINAGFSYIHRKALRHTSFECKNIIENMLERNPSKRISVQSVLRHSWIKTSTKASVKQLDARCKHNIIQKISQLLRFHPSHIESKIRENRYSELGGIYNILTRREVNNLNQSCHSKKLSNNLYEQTSKLSAAYTNNRPQTEYYVESIRKPLTTTCTKVRPSTTTNSVPSRREFETMATKLRVYGTADSRHFNRKPAGYVGHRSDSVQHGNPFSTKIKIGAMQQQTKPSRRATVSVESKRTIPRSNSANSDASIHQSNSTKIKERARQKSIWVTNTTTKRSQVSTKPSVKTSHSDSKKSGQDVRLSTHNSVKQNQSALKRYANEKIQERIKPRSKKIDEPIARSIVGYFNSLTNGDHKKRLFGRNQDKTNTSVQPTTTQGNILRRLNQLKKKL